MPMSPPLGFIGVGLEVTKGTGVVPTMFVPVEVGRVGHDILMQLDDVGMRAYMGAGPFDQIGGPLYSEFECKGPAFADTLPWFIAGVFGEVATVGAAAPFTHTCTLKNSTDGQAKSLSITDFYGLTGGTPARRYSGMQVAEVGLDFNADGLLNYSTKLVGFASALVAKPVQSFTTVTPHPAWECVATIGGAGNLLVEKASLSFKRETTPIFTADGTQAPYKIWQGGLEIDGSLSLVAEDDAELLRYLNATKPVVVLNFTHGAGAGTAQVLVTLSKCNYSDAKPDHGKKWMSWDATLKPLPNTTDVGASGGYGPGKVAFQNALPAATYQ